MLWLLGVQMAYVFGLITFVLNFVPNLGPLIATCLPMPLVIFDPGEPPGFRLPRRVCFGVGDAGTGYVLLSLVMVVMVALVVVVVVVVLVLMLFSRSFLAII